MYGLLWPLSRRRHSRNRPRTLSLALHLNTVILREGSGVAESTPQGKHEAWILRLRSLRSLAQDDASPAQPERVLVRHALNLSPRAPGAGIMLSGAA